MRMAQLLEEAGREPITLLLRGLFGLPTATS
jgi:hypothetical protein